MPPQSRSQRRRQGSRQQGRPATASAGTSSSGASTGTTIPLDASDLVTRPARPATRRVLTRQAPEPVDYTKDYAAAARDLRWIVIWTVLLFGLMIALKLSGLV